MIVVRDPAQFPVLANAVVTSGTFDGVHLGHVRILEQLTTRAREVGGQSVVLTYWPHPRLVLDYAPQDERPDIKLLSTLDEKIALLEAQGVDYLLVQPFTREFALWSAEEYVRLLLVETLRAKHLVIGYDHRFGHGRAGGLEYLQANAQRFGFTVEEIPRRDVDAVGVSSTRIRKALEAGEISTADRYLGRPYELTGTVVRGNQLGRTIGYPTANLRLPDPLKLVPADGVYAARARVADGTTHPAMVNIGMRPTVGGKARTTEAHLLGGFDQDLYDQPLTLYFVARLRDEQKFDGLEALKAQLARDADSALAALSS